MYLWKRICVCTWGHYFSEVLPLSLLLILDICVTVDTGWVQVPAVTRQTEHLSAAARNYHRQTWSTTLNSCFDLPPATVVTTRICWTVTVVLLAEQCFMLKGTSSNISPYSHGLEKLAVWIWIYAPHANLLSLKQGEGRRGGRRGGGAEF